MAATLEDVAWDLEPLVDGEGEAGVDRRLQDAQDRSAVFAERFQGKVASIDGAQLAEAVAALHAMPELGRPAGTRLFSELTSAVEGTVDGETQPLDVALARLMSSDRELRERVQQAVTEALQPTLRVRAFVFNTLMADKFTDDRLRSYPTWISS